MGKVKVCLCLWLVALSLWLAAAPTLAIVNPGDFPNNKFGIHLITASTDEAAPAAALVNSSGGDWGYITILLEDKDRDHNKWQNFFNYLRRIHLIPIVRLATAPQGDTWKVPYEGEELAWADFLDSLNWPTKNRYVIIYNEPNHGSEWGRMVDPKTYAKVLNSTIDALKRKSDDFFILNAGLDASTPFEPPNYLDIYSYLKLMNDEIPGIFNKLDGWSSHSYPNPGFVASPLLFGKGTIRSWLWEIQTLRSLGLTKDLPILITETGWKHSEGMEFNKYLPSGEVVAQNYSDAFNTAWNSSQIMAVTPFVLNYQESPFDHFSFKKFQSADYYPQFATVQEIPKIKGQPYQISKATVKSGEVYKTIVSGENYIISITFQNNGQSIWGEEQLKIQAVEGGQQLGINPTILADGIKVEPGGKATLNLNLKAPKAGKFRVRLQLFNGGRVFDQEPLEYTTEVKDPVILQINSSLKWKADFSGEYLLAIKSQMGLNMLPVILDQKGKSENYEARYLLPDYKYTFVLKKNSYKEKTIEMEVKSGVNNLDFGVLDPELLKNLINPAQLWELLPFSN